MKRKFYVAALATLALAACNNEDLLVENNPSVKSSVMFNVSLDGNGSDSRAAWGGLNGYTLKWLAEDADRLSFFHGANSAVGSVIGAQNAIYKAESVGAEGVKFTTHSMVNPGWGVMVYPCDTTFLYASAGKLYVEIPAVQTAESNKLLPFVSNVINIAPFNAIKGDGAGYAKEYDIALKQVGTQFTMNVDWNGETLNKITALSEVGTILPINVVASQLSRQENFQRSAEIIILDQTPVYEAEGRDSWVKVTKGNEATTRFLDNVLTTKDIKGLSTSEFTLLPTSGATTNAAAYVKIYTRYGSVTINNTAGKVWHKATELNAETWKTIPQGIQELVDLTLNVKDDEDSKFDNERVGGHVTRYIAADLENLNMSDVCITNDKHLHDIILVHDALQEGEAVTFTINGDEDGVFEMSMATLNMLNERPEIKIEPCTEPGEACTAIRLTGATEVPEFEFLTGSKVDIYLAAEATAWTWNGLNKEIDNINTLVNEGILNVAGGSQLGGALGGYAMKNEGTININGTVKQHQSDMVNFGTINIAVGAEYLATGVTITNSAYDLEDYGKIYNSGILATSKLVSGSVINNYGYIENVVGGTANMTYITSNQYTGATLASPFSWNAPINLIGTIKLKNANDNISVLSATEQGFIKYVYTANDYITPAICKYNYVIVNNHDINFTEIENEVLYLEVTSTGNNIPVITQANYTNQLPKLKCFILNGKANLAENNKLVTPIAYIKGKFYVGGLFTQNVFPYVMPKLTNTYFGDSDDECIVSFE